jgi:hypothetical protein
MIQSRRTPSGTALCAAMRGRSGFRALARAEIDQATQTAKAMRKAELVRLAIQKAREAAEQMRAEALQVALDQARTDAQEAVQIAEALRQEVARATEAHKETVERPAMVASKIDEVQFRRLQEAEQARKSLGRLARLRAAWPRGIRLRL